MPQRTGLNPIPGNDLHISLDVNIQKYAEQLAYQVLEKKNAKKVSNHRHESPERGS